MTNDIHANVLNYSGMRFWVQSVLIPEEVNNVTPILKRVPAGIKKNPTDYWSLALVPGKKLEEIITELVAAYINMLYCRCVNTAFVNTDVCHCITNCEILRRNEASGEARDTKIFRSWETGQWSGRWKSMSKSLNNTGENSLDHSCL